MRDLAVKIIENKQVSSSFFLLKFKYPTPFQPGQFINVRLNKQIDPYLRRPLSIHDYDAQNQTVTLLYKAVGKGTKYLSDLKSGAALQVLGPLGNSFDLKGLTSKSKVALVGGGIGFAPLLFLAKELAKKKVKIYSFFGFRNKTEIYVEPLLKKISTEVIVSTDDGSAGRCGYITACFAEELKKQKFNRVYVCGPDSMMKIAHAICKKAEVKAQYSLESIMGCGLGACMCCVTETVKGYKKICSDGPVFWDGELTW